MKKILLPFLIYATCFIPISATNSYYAIFERKCTINIIKDIADDEWVYVGEISVHSGIPGTVGYSKLPVNLYVRELGNTLIYRIEYKGQYYAAGWNSNSNAYIVTINNCSYVCDIPSPSNNSSSTEKTGLQRFVGVWKPNESFLGDIHISIKDGKLFVEMKTSNGIKSSFAEVRDEQIIWSVKVNEDYGKYRAQYTSSGKYILLDEGHSYQDKEYLEDVNSFNTQANREVLWDIYYGRLNNGNLDVKMNWKYTYFNNNEYVFYREHKSSKTSTYTQW